MTMICVANLTHQILSEIWLSGEHCYFAASFFLPFFKVFFYHFPRLLSHLISGYGSHNQNGICISFGFSFHCAHGIRAKKKLHMVSWTLLWIIELKAQSFDVRFLLFSSSCCCVMRCKLSINPLCVPPQNLHNRIKALCRTDLIINE